MTGRRMRIAAVVAGIAMLTGCAGIPQSGAPQPGQAVTVEDDPEFDFLAEGPTHDATQEEILRGFIDAASSPRDDYATAREYLAPAIKSSWNPDAKVTVDQAAQRKYAQVDETAMQLTVAPLASVDERGEYRELESKEPVAQAFSFIKVADQWRISAAPDGVTLDPQKFSEVFSSYALRFFDPSWSYLVPDLRWFPSRASTGTRIVKALLDGPSDWLSTAVSSAFPEGAKLTKNAVPVVGDIAQIDLNSEVFQADDVTLQRMQTQLVASLTGVAAINSVSITINGNTENIPTLTINPPRVDPRALVRTGDGFGFVSGDSQEAVPGISGQIEALAPNFVTLNAEQSLAAAGRPDGVYAVRANGSEPLRVDARAGLIAPGLDNLGYLWSVPRDQPGALIASRADGSQSPVATSWPDASSIVSLQVSRDGTRVLVLVTVGGETRLLIAGIERDESNVPVSLGEAVVLTAGSGHALSATWVDELTVASLATNSDGHTEIVSQVVGGASKQLAPLDNAVSLIGGNGERQLRALTNTGAVSVLRTAGWQTILSGATVLATQLGSPS